MNYEEAVAYIHGKTHKGVKDGLNNMRKLLKRLKPVQFTEMKESGKSSICCGNCAWTGCDSYSKAMQVKRLEQAHATGSDLLVTACPKCQIHLKCAMEDPFRGEQLEIELMDLTSVIAQTIQWK